MCDSPLHHPLRDRLADAGAFLHPHRRRRPEALHLGELAEDRHAVGGERDETVDRVLHPDRLVADDLGHQLERVLHLIGEVGLRERELRRRQRRLLDRRDLLRVVEDRAVRVGADLEADAVLALVHEHVHVAHDRELDRARRGLEARHRADVDHLVHGGRERNVRAGHLREQRAPHAAGDHDHLGLDHAARGVDAPDAAVLDVHRAHVRVGEHLQAAALHPPLAHDRAGAQGVDNGDGRAVEAAEQDRLVDVGHELLDLRRRDEPGRVDAPRLRRRHPPSQLLHPLLGARDLDAAALGVDAHLDVLPLRLERELGHLLRVVDREDEVGRVPGRAAGVRQRAFVDLDDVGPAEPGEVVREAVADDAAADHDGAGLRGEVAHGMISCSVVIFAY